jgi:hypothetical protein
VRCALWWAVLAALLLAGCDTNSSRRSSLVSSVRVLSAAAEGTVAAITETSVSGIDENGDPYTGSFRTWQVYRGEDRLKGLESFELQPYPDVLSAVGPDGTLWWAQDLPLDAAGPRRVQLCFQRSGEEPGCQSAAFSNPDAIAGVALHALALDDEGDAVLLAGGAGQWLSLSMPARAGAAARRHDLSIPAEAVDPRLMHGAQGATVTWYEPGLGLRLLRMSDPARGWQAPDHPGRISTPVWAAAQQRGVGGRFWLFACSDVGPGFVPEMAMLLPSGVWQSVSAPPALGDCASLVDPPLLAVSDNGDALLAWTDGVATPWMAAHRDAATGTWSEPVAFEPDVSPRRLVADELGHFALLSFDGSVFEPVLRLRAYAPHAGWQPAMVVDQDRAAQGEGDVAASQGRAVVAWARYVTTGTEVQSLLADASFDLASNLAPLGVQVEGDAGGLASVVSTPAGIACPGDCRLDVPPGSPVTLEARPGAGQRFAGWSGICRSDDARVTIDVPAGGGACTARFEPQAGFALTLQVQGNGSISTNPPGPAYPPSTVVTLTATPGAGQRFVAWGGDADCADGQVTMDAPRHCNAAFEPDPALAAMTLEVSGGGRVTSTPAGLDCSGRCSAYFPLGQSVVLSAAPPAGATASWAGACGTATGLTATVLLSSSAQCSVDFTLPATPGWQTLAGSLPGSGGLVRRPAIATDAQGKPTVAFLTQSAELVELNVLQYDGSAWHRLGPGPVNDAFVSASQPSLALDAQGQPLLAFGDANGRIQVRHWNGSAWQRRADGLAVNTGALGSQPQIAFDGTRAVLAFWEFGGSGQARIALLRGGPETGAWTGGFVDGVTSTGDGELRLALDGSGLARIAYVVGSGLAGEQAPQVVQESATGWGPLCDGGAGDAPGLGYAITQMGFGLQMAPDGSALLVRPRSDFTGVQAWHCAGSGPWVTHGAGQGRLVDVDNVSSYLQGMAMAGGRDAPTLAVMIDNGYNGTAEIQVFGHTPGLGFALVGPPLLLPARVSSGQVAVAPGAPGAPVVAYGVEAAGGRTDLHSARWRP